MKLTILGSCKVVDWPTEIACFFKGEHVVDPRNGSLMEMDALSIYHFANFYQDKELARKCVLGVLNNLGNKDFWEHGAWGFKEVHLRFTSSALRLLLITNENHNELINEERLISLLEKHSEFHERLSSGIWFYHDSIESDNLSYYPLWEGIDFLSATPKNKLILNTHLDTLTTLLIACNMLALPASLHNMVDEGLNALEAYWKESIKVNGWFNLLDLWVTSIYSFFIGRRGRISKKLQLIIKQFLLQQI